MHGETVVVFDQIEVGRDELNAVVHSESPVPVEGVLVAPGAAQNIPDVNRTDGAVVSFTLYFPKDYEGDLYAKRVEVRGKSYRVLGYPQRYAPEDTPGRWNMVVEVEATNG